MHVVIIYVDWGWTINISYVSQTVTFMKLGWWHLSKHWFYWLEILLLYFILCFVPSFCLFVYLFLLILGWVEPKRNYTQFDNRSFSKTGDQTINIFYNKLLKQPTIYTKVCNRITEFCNNERTASKMHKVQIIRYLMESNKKLKRTSSYCLENVK